VELFVADTAAERLDLARKAGLREARLSADPFAFKNAVDAVVVATPAQSHFDLCQEFLEAGKDVFVEKPITLESADAMRLVELAERRGRVLQVGHIFRFDSATQWMRDAIGPESSGRCGSCADASADSSVRAPTPASCSLTPSTLSICSTSS
jgi:predicted dehydrogenase